MITSNLKKIDPVQYYCGMHFSHYIGSPVRELDFRLSLGIFFGPVNMKDDKKSTYIFHSNIFE